MLYVVAALLNYYAQSELSCGSIGVGVHLKVGGQRSLRSGQQRPLND